MTNEMQHRRDSDLNLQGFKNEILFKEIENEVKNDFFMEQVKIGEEYVTLNKENSFCKDEWFNKGYMFITTVFNKIALRIIYTRKILLLCKELEDYNQLITVNYLSIFENRINRANLLIDHLRPYIKEVTNLIDKEGKKEILEGELAIFYKGLF